MGVPHLRKISYFPVVLGFFTCSTSATRGVRGARQKHHDLNALTVDVHVVTCTDSLQDARAQLLVSRVKDLGYTPHWLNCSDAFENKTKTQWGRRLQHHRKFVEHIIKESPDDPLVIFVDGMDVIAEGSASEAAARFAEYDTPVVMSCVDYQFPKECEAYSRLNVSGTCAYPCGGAYMGRASGLRKLFRHGGKFYPETDDQCWLFSAAYEHLKVNEDYKLDTHSRMFLSITSSNSWLWAYSLDHGRHKFNVADIHPSPTFVHLDSAKPTPEVMMKLQRCQPGSTEVLCNQRFAGWWPQPKQVSWVLRSTVALLPIVALLLFMLAAFALERLFFRKRSPK